MKQLNAEMLVNACKDDSFDAGITIRASLEPLGGHGAPIKPATYAGGKFQTGKRWIIDTGGNQQPVDILVIDNEPSEANRLEASFLPDVTNLVCLTSFWTCQVNDNGHKKFPTDGHCMLYRINLPMAFT